MQVRINWIDWAKLIGIYFVILGHYMYPPNSFTTFIYSFHMPLFFILSGYFEKDKQTVKESISDNLRKLIIPYFFFCFISYIWWLINGRLGHGQFIYSFSMHDLLLKPLLGILFTEGRHTELYTSVNVSLWFLAGLFFCRLIFKIATSFNINKWKAIFCLNIICVIAVLILKKINFNVYFSIDSALMAMPFYSFGYFLKTIDINVQTIKKKWVMISIPILLFIGIMLSQWNGRTDMNGCVPNTYI